MTPVINPKRPDGKYGKDCTLCAAAGRQYTEEMTFEEYKKAHDGKQPFGGAGTDKDKVLKPEPHVAIVHPILTCFEFGDDTKRKVKQGKCEACVLEPTEASLAAQRNFEEHNKAARTRR